MAAVRLTAFLREFAFNVSISYPNHCFLSPACPSVNRWATFGRVNVDLREVQHCLATFESDLV